MPGVLPLRTLCENTLIRHHLLLKDLGDLRLSLIKRVLHRFTAHQLINLEQINPLLVLEDDDIWLVLLRREYPQDVHDKYTSQPLEIKKFYRRLLKGMGFDITLINLDNYIQYHELHTTKQYRLPYRQVYSEIKQHYIDKQEEAIINLRKNMQKLERSKDNNRVIHLDEIIPVDGKRVLPVKRTVDNRSPLFQRAQLEAKKRRELFRNPLSLMPKRSTSVPVRTRTASKNVGPAAPTSPPQAQLRPVSPIRHRSPPHPQRRTTSSVLFVPKKQAPCRKRASTSTSTSTQTPLPPSNPIDKAWQDQERAVKKIKLCDYLKRKM